MHDVEHHTICYLRDVLVTDAHRDVEITTFLTFWVYEEHWHDTRHLARFLFGGPEGRAAAARIDRQVDRLPGLAGLGLVGRAAARRAA